MFSRPDLDPNRPKGLTFKLPAAAQELLVQQLPSLAQQQQELLQLTVDQGLLPQQQKLLEAATAASNGSSTAGAGTEGASGSVTSTDGSGGDSSDSDSDSSSRVSRVFGATDQNLPQGLRPSRKGAYARECGVVL